LNPVTAPHESSVPLLIELLGEGISSIDDLADVEFGAASKSELSHETIGWAGIDDWDVVPKKYGNRMREETFKLDLIFNVANKGLDEWQSFLRAFELMSWVAGFIKANPKPTTDRIEIVSWELKPQREWQVPAAEEGFETQIDTKLHCTTRI
jgi:hypothetical protein